jgi:hypothetical protein
MLNAISMATGKTLILVSTCEVAFVDAVIGFELAE